MIKLALIGKNLAHTQSPKVHEEIMRRNDIDGQYTKIDISCEDIESVLNELKTNGYRGVNVTSPYKETILPYLDELDERVKYIGATNTILFKDGKIYGYNTDYLGFIALLNDNDITVKGKDVVVLGSGGAARAVAKALIDLGAYDLTFVTRNKQLFHNIYSTSYEFFEESPQEHDIIINCTPVGQFPDTDKSPLPKETVNADCVIDLIYNPKKSKLLKYAEENGAIIINGHRMLVKQALESHKIWSS